MHLLCFLLLNRLTFLYLWRFLETEISGEQTCVWAEFHLTAFPREQTIRHDHLLLMLWRQHGLNRPSFWAELSQLLEVQLVHRLCSNLLKLGSLRPMFQEAVLCQIL